MKRPRLRGSRNAWMGYGTAALIGLLLVGSTLISRIPFGDHTVQAEFIQAAGLKRGDTVDLAGIQVGTVGAERIERDHVLVDLQLDSDLKLGPDAHATIELTTILGKMHVALTAGNHKGLPGHRITLAHTAVPYNLAKVVNDPRYTNSFEHLEKLDPQLLRQSLDVMAQQMGDSPALTVDALNSVGALAKVIADRRDEVDGLLKNMDVVSKLVADNQNSLLLLLTRGRAVGDAIAQRQGLLKELLDNIAALSKELQQMGIDNHGQLGPLIHSLDTMSEGLEKNHDNLNRLLQIAPVTLRQFNNIFGNGPYGDVYVPWGLFPDNWVCLVRVVNGCN